MNNETFYQILDKIENISEIESKDIPSLDLYMDQIMTLFDIHLSDHKRYEDDKLLTKTMINNYSKEGILKPIKGKKYTKEHIIQMLLIYSLKNTISIHEIKKILQPYHDQEQEIEPIYDEFLKIKKETNHLLTQQIDLFMKDHHIDISDSHQLTLLLLTLCSLSNQLKMISENVLDTFYKDDDE